MTVGHLELGQKGAADRPWICVCARVEYWNARNNNAVTRDRSAGTIVSASPQQTGRSVLLLRRSAAGTRLKHQVFLFSSLTRIFESAFVGAGFQQGLSELKVNPKRRRRRNGRMICVSGVSHLGRVDSSGRTTDVQTRAHSLEAVARLMMI